MPGPKQGPRPADFDEDMIKQSPTYLKWANLEPGARLRYACRDFIKGNGDDEERLMRRIMIARRNNLRDHETLKRARQTSKDDGSSTTAAATTTASTKPPSRKRRATVTLSDDQVLKEMDQTAVTATRSYRAWMELENGKEFVYNQKYTKGKPGHDWLLRKNIWRRMRYRRENKKMVERHRGRSTAELNAAAVVDHALLASAAAAAGDAVIVAAAAGSDEVEPASELVHKAVVEAAVAAAESYVKEQTASSVSLSEHKDHSEDVIVTEDALTTSIAAMTVPTDLPTGPNRVHNPLEVAATTAAATNEALDAAAKLAAAVNHAPALGTNAAEDRTAPTVLAEDDGGGVVVGTEAVPAAPTDSNAPVTVRTEGTVGVGKSPRVVKAETVAEAVVPAAQHVTQHVTVTPEEGAGVMNPEEAGPVNRNESLADEDASIVVTEGDVVQAAGTAVVPTATELTIMEGEDCIVSVNI